MHAALWEAELGNRQRARQLAAAVVLASRAKEVPAEAAVAALALARAGDAVGAENIPAGSGPPISYGRMDEPILDAKY